MNLGNENVDIQELVSPTRGRGVPVGVFFLPQYLETERQNVCLSTPSTLSNTSTTTTTTTTATTTTTSFFFFFNLSYQIHFAIKFAITIVNCHCPLHIAHSPLPFCP